VYGVRWVRLGFLSDILSLLSFGLNLTILKTDVPANEQYKCKGVVKWEVRVEKEKKNEFIQH
jgi:hypothetical protein